MIAVSTPHRKLIDIKPEVFDGLSAQAARKGISLKRLIENILEEACPVEKKEFSPSVNRIIGSAIPQGKKLSDIEDERFKYLLSK